MANNRQSFTERTIVPKGRFKYGEYMSAGNVTSKVSKTIYSGNGSTEDLGGGGNTGGDTGGTENLSWQLFLSKGSYAFDGATLSAVGSQSAETSVIGVLGTDVAETYVGDITGDYTEDLLLSSTSVSSRYISDTTWKGVLTAPPENPSNGWCYYDASKLAYFYYNSGLVQMDSNGCSGDCEYVPSELPANYGITGMPTTGMVVVVNNNGDAGTTIEITVDNTIPASAYTGTLYIPCAVSLKQNQLLENGIVDWEAAFKTGKATQLILEFSWSVSSNAQSNYRLDLSNDAGSINCDEDGNVLTGATRPSCQATLYFGNDPYTAATYQPLAYNTTQNVVGLGSHVDNNGVLYIDYDSPVPFNFDGDHLDIGITAIANGVPQGPKVFTITKSMPSDGHPATSYWMVFNSSSVKVNPNTIPATVTPTAITAEVMMQVGQETPTAATGCSIYYGYTDTPATSYPSTGVTVNVSEEAVYFVAKKGNAIVDGVEQIPILKDGLKGEAGQSAYHLDLNNQSASINCDSSGNILTGAIRPTCKAQLYHGTSACTGVTYSIASANCSYTGVTVQPTGATSAATITFAPGTASTPFWFDTSYTCLELTIEARIGGALYGSAIMSVSRSIAGADGRSITGVTEWYALNNNQSTAPTSGWTTGITNPTSATPFLWNYEEIHYNAGSATTTSPVIIARYTKDGKGISAITEFYAINNSSTTPPTSWSNTMEVPTDSKPYLWNKEEILYTDGSIDYTDPVIIGIKGSNGQPAVSYWLELSADEVKLTTANTFTPATITAKAWKQVGENAPTGATDATILWDYDTTTPTSPYTSTITVTGTSHNYITFRLMVGNVQRDIETVLILRDGKDGTGTQGRQGAAIRGPIDWYDGSNQSGRRWCNGQLTDNSHPEDAMWIDVIIKDGTYYYCNTSYNEAGQAWSAVSSNWTSADTEFDFVATNILLASTATINFLTNNELYLRDSNGNITGGAAGGDGVNFWAGSDTPGDAPFQVSADGSIKAMSGTFAGYIQMPYYFISNLVPDEKLTASTVGTKYISQTIWKGKLTSAPENPASGWCYYNTSTSPGKFYYYTTTWRQMTNVNEPRGYVSDEHAYLIADGFSGNYGMGDGGMLVIPEPSAALNGFTYHIVVVPNIATRAQGQNPAISVMTANASESFIVYCYTTMLETSKRLSFYGGHVEMTCVPVNDGTLTPSSYIWAVTQCTGGVDCYSGTTNASFTSSYSTVCGYSTEDPYQCITKIKADSSLPSNKKVDTLYITRN